MTWNWIGMRLNARTGNIYRTFVNAHIADTHEMHLHAVVECYENSRHDWDTRVFNFYLPLDN